MAINIDIFDLTPEIIESHHKLNKLYSDLSSINIKISKLLDEKRSILDSLNTENKKSIPCDLPADFIKSMLKEYSECGFDSALVQDFLKIIKLKFLNDENISLNDLLCIRLSTPDYSNNISNRIIVSFKYSNNKKFDLIIPIKEMCCFHYSDNYLSIPSLNSMEIYEDIGIGKYELHAYGPIIYHANQYIDSNTIASNDFCIMHNIMSSFNPDDISKKIVQYLTTEFDWNKEVKPNRYYSFFYGNIV